jgi:hypothetical protein
MVGMNKCVRGGGGGGTHPNTDMRYSSVTTTTSLRYMTRSAPSYLVSRVECGVGVWVWVWMCWWDL